MKTKSIWGNPPSRLYKLINIGQKKYGKNFTTCIVGCSDGKFLMPFARKNYKVTGYDIDEIALYGGEKNFPIIEKKEKFNYSKDFVSKKFKLEEKQILGVTKRLEIEELTKNTIIEKRDFYKNPPKTKFDIVFTSCSLHYTANKEFSLEQKVRKMQEIVKRGGLLYIDYMMAINEEDYDKYPENKFFRKGEIKNYFNNDWKIISIKENNKPSFEGAHVDCVIDHFHRFGYVLAEKIK